MYPARPSKLRRRCQSRPEMQPQLGLRQAFGTTVGAVWDGRAGVADLFTGSQSHFFNGASPDPLVVSHRTQLSEALFIVEPGGKPEQRS